MYLNHETFFKNRLVLLGIARWRGPVSINCDHRNFQPHRNLWLASQVKMKSFLGLAVAPFVTAYHCPGSSSTVHASCKARIVRTSPTHQSWHEFHRDVKAGFSKKKYWWWWWCWWEWYWTYVMIIMIMIITIGFFKSTMAWPLALPCLDRLFLKVSVTANAPCDKVMAEMKARVDGQSTGLHCIYVTSVIFHLLLGLVFFTLP